MLNSQYVSYRLEQPPFEVKECQLRGLTYACSSKSIVAVGYL